MTRQRPSIAILDGSFMPSDLGALQSAVAAGKVRRVGLENADVHIVGTGWDAQPPGRPVVAVVGSVANVDARRLLASGVSGILPFDGLKHSLGPAVQLVSQGLCVIPSNPERADRHPDLTTREKQVLGLITLGETNAAIARRLFIAESTVKYHALSIYGKLGVRNRREAAELAVDPAAGLSLGVLELSGRRRTETTGYRRPAVD